MTPPEDLQAALVAAESDADASFSDRAVGAGVLPCGAAAHWVEFELLDGGEPAAGVRYELRLPGRVARGELNSRGKVRVEGIAQAGTCTITFPDLDAEAAEEGESAEGPREESGERGTLYVAGETPAPVPLDASHCYRLPTWDLVVLGIAAPTSAPDDGAARELTEEEAEEQDDWVVTDIGFSDKS